MSIFKQIGQLFLGIKEYVFEIFEGDENMKSGELDVTGINSISISIDKFPSEVKCHFVGDCVVVPCNPADADVLEFDVVATSTSFNLVISWSVSGVRKIKWHVAY